MFEHFSFKPFLIITGFAWVLPILASRIKFIKIPSVILEILAGVIIGKSGFDLIKNQSHINFLALTGFIILMFLSGLEVDVRKISANFRSKGESAFSGLSKVLFVFLLSLGLSAIFSYGLSFISTIEHPWYIMFLLATTSVGIVVPTLKERNELATKFGQTIMLSAVTADVITFFLITISALVYSLGFKAETFLLFLIFPVLLISYLVGKVVTKKNYFKRISNDLSHASSQIKVRGTMFLLFSFLVLSELIGAELILGAFFAGIILSRFTYKERSTLILKLDGMGYGFFIPVFFIMVGVNFDLEALKHLDHSYWLILYLVIAAFTIKVVPSLFLKEINKTKQRVAAGFLLSSRLSLIIAAAEIGSRLNIISDGLNSAVILLAWISCLISPVIYSQLAEKFSTAADRVIIIGAGKIGRALAARLKMHGKNPLILENDEHNYKKCIAEGLEVVKQDGLQLDYFENIKLSSKNSIVIVTGNDKTNLVIGNNLIKRYPFLNIIARDNKPESALKLKELGIVPMNLILSGAAAIENLIFRPTTYNALIESFDHYEVEEIFIDNKKLKEKKIRDIPFPKDGFLLLINRDGEVKIPHGDTKLRIGDIITTFGTITALKEFNNIFRGEHVV